MILCDTHADTLYEIGVKLQQKPKVTAQSLKTGKVSLQVLALWTGPDDHQGNVQDIIAKEKSAFHLLLDQGFNHIKEPGKAEEGKLNLMLSIEGGEVFEGGVQTVRDYADIGVRMAAIVWNNLNALATPAKLNATDGLTDYGFAVVNEMQKYHMAVDVSHLNERGFNDLFLRTNAPPLASHSCCRSIYDHFRNLTDQQIRLLIQNGGYIGLNFYPAFLTGQSASLYDIYHHIDYICQMGGARHVGFGSDFDGIESTPEGLDSPADFPALIDYFRSRGYSETDIEYIAGKNLVNYYARV